MAEYSQTHAVPNEGLPAWAGPDGSGPPAANLDPGLDVMVFESRGQWAHIRCSNGWEAWVDARRLIVSAPARAAAPAPPPPGPPGQVPPPPPQSTPSPSQAAPPPPTQPVPRAAPPTQPGSLSAAWEAPATGTPAAAPGAPRAAGGFELGPGQIIALVGGVVFFVSSWFTWLRIETRIGGGSASSTAYQTPAKFLLDSAPGSSAGLSLGIIIAFFAVACIAAALLGALNRSLGFLSVVTGGIAFLIVVLFLIQAKNFADQLPQIFKSGYFDVLRFGVVIALVGAILSLVGGVLTLAQKR
jgi:hypothetical protein